MDINSYETFKVVETMREYGAPYSALAVATGLPESILKAYCRRADIGVCQRRLDLTQKRRREMTQNADLSTVDQPTAEMSAGGVSMTPDFLRSLSL